MTDIKNILRNVAIVLALLFLYEATTGKHVDPIIVEKIVEGKKEIEIVERIVVKTVKPDGTLIEKIVEREKTTKEETKTVDKSSRPSTVVFGPKSQYSLHLKYLPALTEPPSYKHVELEAGFRLSSSNFWLTTGYNVKHNQFTVGILYEF